MRPAILVLAIALTGCATKYPTPVITTPVETIEVKTAVGVSCVDEIPVFPVLEPVPKQDIDAQTLARVKRESQLRAHVDELTSILKACQ